jgi:arylsulfatase A-like enzyme
VVREKSILLSLLAYLVFGAACAQRPGPVSPPPRHVILISLDTLRADHLGAYGYPRATSPYFDALARRGTLFRRAVANAPSTAPSHGALLSSVYPSAFSAPLTPSGPPPAIPLLAEILRGHGFATWGFTDGGFVASAFGFGRGFDQYREERVGLAQTNPAIEHWLDTHQAERWFLFVHTYDVHTPYGGSEVARRALDVRGWRGSQKIVAQDLEGLERAATPPADLADVVALYDAGIRHADEMLGDLLALLERRGLLASSLVVITSDHGEEFFEHGRTQHKQLYLHPNLRVPLLILVPRRVPRVVDDTVELVDVLPTVLEILGLPPHPGAMGRSLLPLIDGESRGDDALAYAEGGLHSGMQRTVVTDRWQLLYDAPSGRVQLFDLDADPGAHHDVAPAHPEVSTRLTAQVRRRMHQAAARRVPAPAPRVAPETRRQLEQLGYVEGALP